MRGFFATLLLLLVNLQPIAGAALCLRHHESERGAACEAAMQAATPGGGHTAAHPGEMALADGTPPMTDECAAAMVCAAPAPIVTGPFATAEFAARLLPSEASPPVAHRPDAPAAPFFRPPIA